jgi:hypothetical protein
LQRAPQPFFFQPFVSHPSIVAASYVEEDIASLGLNRYAVGGGAAVGSA